MLGNIVRKSLDYWGLDPLEVNFITQRENHMYKVVTKEDSYCFRLHRKGLRSEPEIQSEGLWINMLRYHGMNVPDVVPSLTGDICHTIDGIVVDVFKWLPGDPMGVHGVVQAFDNMEKIYYQLGYAMAELHDMSDSLELPENFVRPVWDADGIIGENPIWGRFWENHCLYFTDRSALCSVRYQAAEILDDYKDELDFGLIHADAIPDNVLVNNEDVNLVNFGDSGFGYRLFDVATVLNKAMREKDYRINKRAFLKGYRSCRPLDETHLLLFQALRSFTYLGWIVPRLNEPKGSERCQMFIDDACDLAAKFLVAAKIN